MNLIGYFLFIILVYLYFKLSARVRRCESLLKQIKTLTEEQSSLVNQRPEKQKSRELLSQPPFKSENFKKSTVTITKVVTDLAMTLKQLVIKKNYLRKYFTIPNIIKENWMGVFGSIALVIGAVFFGLTAKIMQHAEVRVGVMMVASFSLLGISQKLKRLSNWESLRGWLKSIAGTVILFASIGAGGIEGLQFIQSPLYASIFLFFGISINILIAMTALSQAIASLHVILSIIAFCVVPQTFILLPIGALVACIGLVAAYRSKWDVHLLLIVVAFAFQNTFNTIFLDDKFLPWMHYLAIGCSVIVGLSAASIHYSKKYMSKKIEVLPLTAHISNWGLLIWNISVHAQFFRWSFFILAGCSIFGFIIARVAKKKNIFWLYYTDTLFSQLMAISAIVSMCIFSVKPLDLCLIILFETLAFSFVCQLLKEDFLLRIGFALQYIAYMVMINYVLCSLFKNPVDNQYLIYLRMGIITIISWSFYIIGSFKKLVIDDFRFLLFNKKNHKNPVSITTLFGALFFIGVYFFGFNSLVIQGIILSVVGLIALWRKYKEDQSWNIVFISSLVFIHIMSWGHLLIFQKRSMFTMFSRVDFLGLVFLDASLIFMNLLQFKLWKKNIHHLVVYALGIHIGLLTYIFTKKISILIPGVAFLGFSVFAFEASRLTSVLLRYSEDVKKKITEGLIHVGLAFLIAFIIRFVTVHLQTDTIWKGISLRWATEVIGLLIIIYWIVFYPKKIEFSKFTQYCGKWLVESCLGFITLCVFAEFPEFWRPFIWAIMAIGLYVGSINYRWPKRLCFYSWIYLIASIVHIAFVTSNLTMPSIFAIEKHNILVFMAIGLQICYVCLVHKMKGDLVKKQDTLSIRGMRNIIPTLFHEPSLTILLPVFLGIGLLFAFNYEKTILTLIWVVLTCIYLVVGLLIKTKRVIQIAMCFLVFCSIRLVVFDLVQSDLATRSLVFLGVGSLMLGVSILYKKYKHRIEFCEKG